jgi:hypothetical protein
VTRDEARELVAQMVAAWPTPEWPESTVALYRGALERLELEPATRAVHGLIMRDTSGFRPPLGRIMERITTEALGELPAVELVWGQALEACREQDPLVDERDGRRYYVLPAAIYSHDLVREAVCRLGAGRIVAHLEGYGETEYGLRRELEATYRGLVEQVRSTGRLPEGVRTPAEVAAQEHRTAYGAQPPEVVMLPAGDGTDELVAAPPPPDVRAWMDRWLGKRRPELEGGEQPRELEP